MMGHRLQSERQLEQKSLEYSSQAYDKHLLSRIGGPNASGRPAPSHDSSPITSPVDFRRQSGHLKPLSLPERKLSPTDPFSARWSSDTPSTAASPRSSIFRSPPFEHSSSDSAQLARLGSKLGLGASEDTRMALDGGEQGIFGETDLTMEEENFKSLNLGDRSPSGSSSKYMLAYRANLKRRASSPPTEIKREDRTVAGGRNDLYHRRSQQMLAPRDSSSSRFQNVHGSISSASSASTQPNASYASSYGLSVASSATSYTPTERVSPSMLSPTMDSELGPLSPFAPSRSLNPSPRGSISRPGPQQRGPSDAESVPTRKTSTDSSAVRSRQSSVSKKQGMLFCDCCPKKPKKFESEEELR